jgi:TetR/AcrR family transcriptional regulator
MAAKPDTTSEAREQLLTTAARVMRDNDTIDVSLSELSRQSGLNSALVKYYFGNKAGLMQALLEREMSAVLEALEDTLAIERDPATRLRAHIGGVIDKFFEVPFIQRLLMHMIEESPPHDAQRLADLYLKPVYAAYDRMIADGVEAGLFRPVDSRFFFFTLTGAVDRFFAARMFMRYCFGEDSLSEDLRDRFRDHTVDFIMAGILKD